jgi:hypothetical protein
MSISTTTNLRRANQEQSSALQACSDQLERLRSLHFVELDAQDGVGFAVDASGTGRVELRAPPGDADGLPGLISVKTVASSGAESLRSVRAIVRWVGSSGTRTFSLDCLMTNRRSL